MASPSTTQQMVSGALIDGLAPNKSKTGATAHSNNAHSLATPANYTDIASLDARLIAINAGVYTQARLNSMTVNDKIYAVILNDDPEYVK